MFASERVRIDPETLSYLKKKARNKEALTSVIRRLLGLPEWTVKKGRPKGRKTTPKVVKT